MPSQTTSLPNLVNEELKERIAEHGSQKAVAENLGISQSHLSDVLLGKRNLSQEQLDKLGLTRVIIHIKNDRLTPVINILNKELSK